MNKFNKLEREEQDLIYYSLAMRKNYIETGDVSLSAQDALNCGYGDKVKLLSIDQIRAIAKIKQLMIEVLYE